MTREEAIDKWVEANDDIACCTCHINPPCSFCVNGYALPLGEYLDLIEQDLDEDGQTGQSSPETDYDRAMRGI